MAKRVVGIDDAKDQGLRLTRLAREEVLYLLGASGLIPPIQFGAASAVIGVTGTDRAWVARNLRQARMRVAAAPSGSDLTAELQHYADGIGWTTVTTLTIEDGSIIEAVVEIDQDQAIGDLVRLNVTSAGLSVAASGVVVDVFWQPTAG